jgi:hypothetical protein
MDRLLFKNMDKESNDIPGEELPLVFHKICYEILVL